MYLSRNDKYISDYVIIGFGQIMMRIVSLEESLYMNNYDIDLKNILYFNVIMVDLLLTIIIFIFLILRFIKFIIISI